VIPKNSTPPRPAPAAERTKGTKRAFYVGLGVLALLLASLPYLVGWLRTPPGLVYSGLVYNVDDSAVYLSWMDQARRGHFFLRNQFSTEAQKGVLFNLFFLLLGNVVRFTGLAPAVVYQAARVIGGALLLWAVTGLLRATLADTRARRIAFALTCFGSGLGWLWSGGTPERGPIDLWQPEAITFLSLYFSPLFTAALALMVVFVTAVLHSERTARLRHVWPAALAGALLGNFHSYDVIPLFATWGAYRVVDDARRRRLDVSGWTRLIVAGLASLPTTAYQYYALRVEPVFFYRAFASKTLTSKPWWVLLGFGVLALLACGLIVHVTVRRGKNTVRGLFVDETALRLMATWAVAGVLVAYVPVAFQRKLLMGVHVPLCVLAGAALAHLTARLPGNLPRIAALGAILLTLPTNLWFVTRDLGRLTENVGSTDHRPYLTRAENDALLWLRANTEPSDAVLVAPDPTAHLRFPYRPLLPHLSVYVPAIAGNVVYNGHWGETPDFVRKLGEMLAFFKANASDEKRVALLQSNDVRYVLQLNALSREDLKDADGTVVYACAPWPARAPAPPYLTPVYANAEVTIYRFTP